MYAYATLLSGTTRLFGSRSADQLEPLPRLPATCTGRRGSTHKKPMLLGKCRLEWRQECCRSPAMKQTIRSLVALAVVMLVASAVCLAQSGGEATYKAKCQSCHGSTGTPAPG